MQYLEGFSPPKSKRSKGACYASVPLITLFCRYSVPLGPSLSVGLFKNCFGDANFFILREAFIASGGFTEDFGVGLEDHEFFASLVFNKYPYSFLSLSLFFS